MRLGGLLGSILFTMVGFLLLGVIGPLCFGMTREVILRLMSGAGGRSRTDAYPVLRNRLVYTLAGGTLWAVGYIALRALWSLIKWVGQMFFSHVLPVIPAWLHAALLPALLFVLGAIVGAVAFRHETYGTTR